MSQHSPEELLNANAAFLQILTIVRLEDEERERFTQAFQETVGKVNAIQGINRVRWMEMIKWIYGWVMHRRPREERQLCAELAAATQEDELRKEELRAMAQLMGKTIYEEGREDQARETLLGLGRKRLGEPLPEIVLDLRKIEDLGRLDRMTSRLLEVSSWAELLETM